VERKRRKIKQRQGQRWKHDKSCFFGVSLHAKLTLKIGMLESAAVAVELRGFLGCEKGAPVPKKIAAQEQS